MEKLKQLIESLRSRVPPATEQEIINHIREYLQLLILKKIYQSKFGEALSFMGGTALRICYDLKRYSEDLDFALDAPPTDYSFLSLVSLVERELKLDGFDLDSTTHEEKIVTKVMFRFSGLKEAVGLRSFRTGQKMHIKLEVDTHPIPLEKGDRESFFVNRFQEIFPILKHNLPTLFAGKILAVLFRAYQRGRDYYDLVWYLSRKAEINIGYLNRGAKEISFRNETEVFEAVEKKILLLEMTTALKDLGPFLEDPQEMNWLTRYSEVYRQLVQERLGK